MKLNITKIMSNSVNYMFNWKLVIFLKTRYSGANLTCTTGSPVSTITNQMQTEPINANLVPRVFSHNLLPRI